MDAPSPRPGDELVDVVDDDDRVVATVPRRRMRAERLRHRAVFVAVALERRAAARAPAQRGQGPVAGPLGRRRRRRRRRPARRTTTRPAASCSRRSASTPCPVPLGGGRHVGRYADDDVDLVARCYRVVHDGPIAFADGEVAEARWVDRRRARRAAGDRRRSCPTASPCCRWRSFSLPASCEHPWRVADRASGTDRRRHERTDRR